MVTAGFNKKTELMDMYLENQFVQSINCSAEDNAKYNHMVRTGIALPIGVYENKLPNGAGSGTFCITYDNVLSHEEKMEYLAIKQTQMINTIKKCMVFFTTLTIISLICTFCLIASYS